MYIRKRNGELAEFKRDRIIIAIESAMAETERGIDNYLASEIAESIEEELLESLVEPTVEGVSDRVEELLMDSERKDVARRYILFRAERSEKRKKGWDMSDLQRNIFQQKYEYKNEGFDKFLDRVSNRNEKIKKNIRDKIFVPAGRILAGRGLNEKGDKVSYSNCFVIKNPEDNLESIFDTARKMARTYSYGGGCGTCLGNLRPSGAEVKNSAKVTTGVVSFATLYSLTTNIIGQRQRRGALMLTLPVSHPDIFNFVNAKTNTDQITGANISVKVDDKFMQAVVDDDDYELYFYVKDTGEEISRIIRARDLMRLIAKNAHDWGEPGVLFWDRVKSWHTNSENKEYKYDSTNPCGEKALPAGGSCVLSSINVSELILEPFTANARVNYAKLWDVTQEGIQFLDEILEEGLKYLPLGEQVESVSNYRQLGLGVMGLADAFIKLGVRYGSKESLVISGAIGMIMANASLQKSALMAKEHGTYPKYNHEAVLKSDYLNKIASNKTLAMVEEYGLRNAELLSIAPTGSISTMVGVSGGIEPIYDISYTRKSETLNGEDTYYKVYTPIVKEYMDYHNISDDKYLPDIFVTAMTLDYKDRVKFQGVWQRYIDSAISSTVNLPKEATVEDVMDVYIKAWEEGVKGITVFRDGCKRIGILTKDGSKQKTDLSKYSPKELQEALDKAIEEEISEDPNICPMCGGKLIFENGCNSCLDCGYSPCSL